MYYRLIVVGVTAALLSVPVIGANADEETVIVDPKTGEIVAINAKNNVSGQQEVIESAKKLCLDDQTVQEVRVDGTVICYDSATSSITSYLDIELKFAQSATSLKTFETAGNTSPCPKGSALVKLEIGGRTECEPL